MWLLVRLAHRNPNPCSPTTPPTSSCSPSPRWWRDLLDGFVSGDWVAELDLSTLERWPASQVGDTLREHHQDRVWRVRYRHRWLYVLVHLEFQSTVDRTMPAPECLCRGAVRVLAYSALLYQDLLRASAEPLPPVLPVVLHHGPGRWTAATEVSELAAPSGAFLAPVPARAALLPARFRRGGCRRLY